MKKYLTISGLVTTTSDVEYEISIVTDLVRKTNHDGKMKEIEKKIF